MIARLLIVHHTPSPGMQAVLDAVRAGAHDDAIEDVEVVSRPALTASVLDVLGADGYLLGTPANIGYMSGALKHFFDTVYYPVLDATVKRPYGLYVHGNSDTTGAVRAVQRIAKGLSWQPAAEPLLIVGSPTKDDLERAYELGGTLAALVSGALL